MDILLLAPHPFYQDRGTPIAVDLLIRALSARGERVDVVTYHEGRPVHYPGVTLHRIPALPLIRNIRPGFSLKKVLCDLFVCLTALRLRARHRYHVTHCIEESVYIGLAIKWLFRTPYIYDMDSSLTQQLRERYPALQGIMPILRWFERLAVRGALVVVPVCDALARVAERYRPARLIVLRDISLLGETAADGESRVNGPGSRSPARHGDTVLLYAGNLESYQGIDLLLESFALAAPRVGEARLVVLGGVEADIRRYRQLARRLGIEDRVRFLGPRPVRDLGAQLAEADILVSPRIRGGNTPMKIYSYLHAGKPILATALPTHTQVLSHEVSVLAGPSPEAFSDGMVRLLTDVPLRDRLGLAGRRLAEERYSYAAFRSTVNRLYDPLAAAGRGAS